jgi:imidazole glycerol-phosphate synthase subunit HisH
VTARVGIVDGGLGNVRSVANALRHVGAEPVPSAEPAALSRLPALVLPGVGTFAAGMETLRRHGLVEVLRAHAASGRPLLGICLGMQLLFDEGEEFGRSAGLGLLRGDVARLEVDAKLPHVGWNELVPPAPGCWQGSLLAGEPAGVQAYFVHSYAARPAGDDVVLSTARYGGRAFCAAVRSGAVVGTQFHPEKSGEAGLRMLERFVAGVPR